MTSNIYIAGNRGLVGTHQTKFYNCSGGNTSTIDYINYTDVDNEIKKNNPNTLILNAATVGGITDDIENSFEIYIKNLTIQNNIFSACKKYNVQNLLLQSSACVYPDISTRNITESDFFIDKPFETYLPTALPKMVATHQCIDANLRYNYNWKTAIISNLFGPNDRLDRTAHSFSAITKKFVIAKKHSLNEIEIWGDGKQIRDFLYVEDAVSGMDYVLKQTEYDYVNVSSGIPLSISELVNYLIDLTDYKGKIVYNANMPQGVRYRVISNERLKNLGWRPTWKFEDALEKTYSWVYDNVI